MFITQYHRHHKPPRGAKFAVGLIDEDRLVGVATAGRPVGTGDVARIRWCWP